jgi:hypothetical protein
MSLFSSVQDYFSKWVFTDSPRPKVEESNGLRKISIQNLKRKSNLNSEIFSNLENHKTIESDTYWYRDTGLKKRTTYTNNFIGSFVHAYNSHGDILLNPDDIWIMICFYFSKYVDINSDKLRNKFVKHDGTIKFVVKEYTNNLEESIKIEKDWTKFFNQITEQINAHTLSGITDELACNFTTTTKTHKLITTGIIMNSFKIYFKYSCYDQINLGYGISNVYFQGTRNDWVKIIGKIFKFRKYDVDGKLLEYLGKIQDILQEFLNTWDNKPNIDFWNKIMSIDEKPIGTSGLSQNNIDGWLLHFYGIYSRVDLDDVPDYSYSVPIELLNKFTNETKQMEIKSSWISISKPDEYTFKPDIGLCVVAS